MLPPTLRRNVGNGAFQNLQQRLLHAFAGNIASDGRVLVLAPDLVDFIDVDDPGLRPTHISIRRLQQFEDDVLNVLADIAGLGQRRRIHDRERNVQHARQGLRHQSLARSRRPDQHDVRLRQFDAIAGPLPVHVYPLVVVVDRHRQLFLGLLLADYILVEEGLHLLRLGKLVGGAGGRCGGPVIFQNGITDCHALVANVRPGVIAGG